MTIVLKSMGSQTYHVNHFQTLVYIRKQEALDFYELLKISIFLLLHEIKYFIRIIENYPLFLLDLGDRLALLE